MTLSFSRCFRSALAILVCTVVTAFAEEAKTDTKADKDKAKKPGDWLEIPADGRPWLHHETGIMFPQKLGSFTLQQVFRDKRPEAGIALTYTMPNSDIKADVVLFPCPEKKVLPENAMKIVRKEHEHLVADIIEAATRSGYGERVRSELTENAMPIWDRGNLPMTMQTLDFVPIAKQEGLAKPAFNQWIGLTMYSDNFVQYSVIMPASQIEANRKQTDELITHLIQCIKEPTVIPELLKMCSTYMEHPIEDEGREAADALFAFSKASPVFEIALPGEAITPALNELSERSPDTAVDLLRGFIVGSSVVILQGGTVDQCFDEGTRVMLQIREVLQKKGVVVDSAVLDELAAAAKAGRAAAFLRERMRNASAKQ